MSKLKYLLIVLKGMAMGAADVVPGVSGGTIAFITGIYGELLNSIKNIDIKAVKLLGTFKFRQFWKKINGNFLGSLLLGIAISIFSLAATMKWLLENKPIGTWSFFFGLIIASVFVVSKQVTKWNVTTILYFLGGIAAGYLITILSPTTTPETWWFIMLSGAIAVCAMILPGISGSFILLLLGKYYFIMTAVSEFNIPVLTLFAIGIVVGITSFSHALSWLLKHYHNLMVAFLTGIMLGSLNKVWPWKQVTETFIDSHGVARPLTEVNVLPSTYQALTGNAHLMQAVIWFAVGFLLIFTIEYISKSIRGKTA